MKTLFKVITVCMLTIGFVSSCTLYQGDSIKPSKNRITRTYRVTDFNKVEINTVADVNYRQSTDGTVSVEINGSDNIVALMKVNIKNNLLTISASEKFRLNKKNVTISIISPQLNSVSFKGVGNFSVKDSLIVDDLYMENKGVGDIFVDHLKGNKVTIYSSGVGNVTLKGEVNEAYLNSKGVGNIEAGSLIANKVDAHAKGIGDIKCYATSAINASSKGIGSISYKGNPSMKNINKKGIGTISHN